MKKGRIRQVFAGAFTGDGYVGFQRELVSSMERIFILEGAVGSGKSTLMQRVAQNMQDRGYDVIQWQSLIDPSSVDAVIIENLDIALIDGTSKYAIIPRFAGVVEEIINLGDYWNQSQLRDHKDEIFALADGISASLASAFVHINSAESVYGEYQDGIYVISEIEMKSIAQKLAVEIFGSQNLKVRKFFASAITAFGVESYAQDLSAVCGRRFLLNGNGFAVAEILEDLVKVANEKCQNVDLYYNCLCPQKLEMVILPSLSVAVMDAGISGLEPMYTDCLLNVGGENVDIDVDIEADIVADGVENFEPVPWQAPLDLAAADLEACEILRQKIGVFYTDAMDFSAVDGVSKELFAKIWAMAKERESWEF